MSKMSKSVLVLFVLVALSECLSEQNQAYWDSLRKPFQDALLKLATKTSTWPDDVRWSTIEAYSLGHDLDKFAAVALCREMYEESLKSSNTPAPK